MLNGRGALMTGILPDGRVLDLWPLVLGRVRLTISEDAAAYGPTEGW